MLVLKEILLEYSKKIWLDNKVRIAEGVKTYPMFSLKRGMFSEVWLLTVTTITISY